MFSDSTRADGGMSNPSRSALDLVLMDEIAEYILIAASEGDSDGRYAARVSELSAWRSSPTTPAAYGAPLLDVVANALAEALAEHEASGEPYPASVADLAETFARMIRDTGPTTHYAAAG